MTTQLFILNCVYHHTRKNPSNEPYAWNFRNVNVEALCISLDQEDWSNVNTLDIDTIYNCWFTTFLEILSQQIPRKNITVRPRDKLWKAQSTVENFITSTRRVSLGSATKKRNLTTSLIRKAKTQYYKKINANLADPQTSSKKWWSTVKSLTRNNRSQGRK